MPFLDWSQHPGFQFQTFPRTPHSSLQARIELALGPSQSQQLLEFLSDVFSQLGSEIRVELPQGWTLYWKLREGDSRLLLAHPEPDRWVATVALNSPHALSLLGRLREMDSLTRSLSLIELSQEGAWSDLSNLEIVISRAD